MKTAIVSEQLHLVDEIELEYYRLQKIKEGSIDLVKGEDGELDGLTEAGIKRAKEEKAPLSEIVDILNERFGTEFEDAADYFSNRLKRNLYRMKHYILKPEQIRLIHLNTHLKNYSSVKWSKEWIRIRRYLKRF